MEATRQKAKRVSILDHEDIMEEAENAIGWNTTTITRKRATRTNQRARWKVIAMKNSVGG